MVATSPPSAFDEAFASLERLEATAWRSGDPALLRATAAQCGRLLDVAPCAPPADVPDTTDMADDTFAASLAFATQFCLDVAALDELVRVVMTETLGPAAFDYVQAVYVFDYAPRVRAVLDALGDATSVADQDAAVEPAATLWEALDSFLRSVGRLCRLDAVTSELVRLRGARQHDCRLCQSLRSRSAIRAGADDALFALADHPGSHSLTPRQRAALELTDAVLWHPAHLDVDLVTDVRRELEPEERVELALDVMRNAANKIAVALRADAPHVTSGVEIYDIDDEGEAVYGLSLP
jgi:alkylhydroperoxidase family enzyme